MNTFISQGENNINLFVENARQGNTVEIQHSLAARKSGKSIFESIFTYFNPCEIDINAVNTSGITALMAAASNRQHTMIELLIAYGADVNVGGADNITALMLASQKGYKDIINILLAHDADVTIEGSDGQTAIKLAASNGHQDIIRLFLNRGLGIGINHLNNALAGAIENGNVNITKLLLNRGALAGNLDLAVQNNHQDIVNLLIEYGVNWELHPNSPIITSCTSTTTPFALAIAKGDVAQAERILQENPDHLNKQDKFGFTPLMRAVINKQISSVEYLIDINADLNIVNKHELSALVFAMRNWCNEDDSNILSLLLNNDSINFESAIQEMDNNPHLPDEVIELIEQHQQNQQSLGKN